MMVATAADLTKPLLATDGVENTRDAGESCSSDAVRGWRQVLVWRILPLAGVSQLLVVWLVSANWSFAAVESESISAVSWQGTTINMLQWNPHVECYLPNHGGAHGCKERAFGLVSDLLQGSCPYRFKSRQFDFAAIMYTGSAQGLVPPEQWKNLTYDCSDSGNGDDVTLLYNSNLWTPLDFYRAGCMGDNDKHVGGYTKPFVAQAFKSTLQDGMAVLVVGAHYNHPDATHYKFWEMPGTNTLVSTVSDARSRGITKLIVMADTNFPTRFTMGEIVTRSSRDLMRDIGAAQTRKTKATAGKRTCCAGTWPAAWTHIGYDRIMTNFGSRMETEVGLSSSAADKFRSENMHLPVVGSLTL